MSDPRNASAYAFDQLSVPQDLGRLIRKEAQARGESITACLRRRFEPEAPSEAPPAVTLPRTRAVSTRKANGLCPETRRIRGKTRRFRRKGAHGLHAWWSPIDLGEEWRS